MHDVLRHRRWRDIVPPSDVTSIPTMLASSEQALLYTLARDYATGEGAIIDAGCFLGGSSAALLAGIRDRAAPWEGPPVASYDMFRVEEYTVSEYFWDYPNLGVGASFRPLYDAHLAQYNVPHVVYEGDISVAEWEGGPIEILFLDVLKTPAINDSVLRTFMPHLVPGRTVLVHQDYGWGDLPWLHISVEMMRGSLKWIDAVPHCTHVFLLERPLERELLSMCAWSDLDDDRKLELMDRAIDRHVGDTRGMLELSKGVLLVFLGRVSEGKRLIDGVGTRYDSHTVSACKAAIEGYLSQGS